MNRYSLRALHYLVAAAELGSVSRAAVKLHRSQASVSATLSELEKNLGVQLFVRNPAKGITLTPSGQVFVREARGLLAHADELQAIAGALENAVQGDLNVACFVNIAPRYFPKLLAEFTTQFPGVNITLEVGHQKDIFNGLREGRHEVALTFDLDLSTEYEWVPILEVPPHILLSANHPLASSRRLSLHALKEEPLVLLDLPHTREYFLSLFYSQHINPAIRYRVTGFEIIRTLVGNGLGYAVLNLRPRTTKTYDGSVVQCVPIKEHLRPLTIGCLYLKRIALRKLARTFIEFTKGYFSREHRREKTS